MKDSPDSELFTTRRIAVVEGDRDAAEMLHTFFRLMDLEPSLVDPGEEAIATIRRLHPDVALVDADLPELRAVEIAIEIRRLVPPVIVVFTTARNAAPDVPGIPVVAKPKGYEDLLMVMEVVLEMSC